MTILDKAKEVVDGPRQDDYGHPSRNHSRTAGMWTAYLQLKLGRGLSISPRDVCLMNVLQKCARDSNKPTEDNLVDIAGWARNAEMVDEMKIVGSLAQRVNGSDA